MGCGEIYKLLFEGSPDAILVVDQNKTILDCNASAEKLLALKKAVIIGTDFEKFYQENIYTWYSFRELYNLIKSGHAPQPLELEIRNKQNRHDWYKIYSNILRSQEGEILIQLNIRKITERKIEEKKLRTENLDYLFLAQASSELSEMDEENDVFFFLGKNLPFILRDEIILITRTSVEYPEIWFDQIIGADKNTVNQAIQILGKELTSISFSISDSFKQQFSKPKLVEFEGSLYEFFNQVFKASKTKELERLLKIKSIYTIGIADHGQYFGFVNIFNREKSVPINKSLLESFIYLCYLTIDRIRTMKTLADREKQYRILANNVKDVIFTLDLNLNYTYISPSIRSLRGFEPEELIGKPVYTILPPKSLEIVSNTFLNEIETAKKNGYEQLQEKLLEIELTHRDGRTIWAEVKVSFILDKNKTPIGILGVTREVTERKKNEDELLRANKELNEVNAQKNKFFSIIAHDLKSPFGHILNFSSLLTDYYDLYSEDKRRNFIQLINRSTQQIYQLLENLLDWARSQGGKMEFLPQKINLEKMISDIFEFMDNQAVAKKIFLRKNINSTLSIDADEYMLKTILRNLIANAIKFTDEGGIVTVAVQKKDKNIIISVTDNGIGMERSFAESLFQLDGNVSRPGTKGERGTGLGLLLCKEFVDVHHGHISVESTPGNGSTFTIELPIYQTLVPL